MGHDPGTRGSGIRPGNEIFYSPQEMSDINPNIRASLDNYILLDILREAFKKEIWNITEWGGQKY